MEKCAEKEKENQINLKYANIRQLRCKLNILGWTKFKNSDKTYLATILKFTQIFKSGKLQSSCPEYINLIDSVKIKNYFLPNLGFNPLSMSTSELTTERILSATNSDFEKFKTFLSFDEVIKVINVEFKEQTPKKKNNYRITKLQTNTLRFEKIKENNFEFPNDTSSENIEKVSSEKIGKQLAKYKAIIKYLEEKKALLKYQKK